MDQSSPSIANREAFAGLGGFNGSDTTDMLLRSSSTGGEQAASANAAMLRGVRWKCVPRTEAKP